jgi:hypothetical protein
MKYISCFDGLFEVEDGRDSIIVTLRDVKKGGHFTILRDEYNRILAGQHGIFKLVNTPETFPTKERPIITSKSGTKAERAIDIYKSLGVNPDKQLVISSFIEQLNMTKQGATTYYYNTKKSCQ